MVAMMATATERNPMSWRFLSLLRSDFDAILRNTKNGDPNATLESLEQISRAATLIILLGIIAEIVFAIRDFSGFGKFFEVVIPDGLIAVGLIIEYVALGRAIVASGQAKALSDEKVAEANARAEEANRIAEGERLARLKLEKEMAWRTLGVGEYLNNFITLIRPFARRQCTFVTYQDDPEARAFASELTRALVIAGWQIIPSKGFLAFAIELGVTVEFAPSQRAELGSAANALVRGLTEAGISAKVNARAELDKRPTPIITIRIGKKPERAAH
jgi:hypothetical protein